MRSTKLLGIILALSVLGIPLAASAGVPTMMNYQGRLTNSAGSPLDGVYHLTFTIFDAAEGGTAKWTEVHPLVNVNGGLFNVTLGNGTPAAPLVDSVFNLPARWLGIQIDGGAELTPRTRILSSAP